MAAFKQKWPTTALFTTACRHRRTMMTRLGGVRARRAQGKVMNVARVEWTRLDGDDIEAVVGMYICSDFPNAVRVRPRQGDGGVDIFVPGPNGFAKQRAVYQVKKFNQNLTSSQKRKITRSLTTVVAAGKKEGREISQWHLVMPLDLTDHNLARWLKDLTKDADFSCETHGLLYCDTKAAQHPKIVDYYVRDGKERLEAAMNNLTAVIARRGDRQSDEPLMATDVMSDLTSIYKALNDYDPFYRYEFAVSDNPPPSAPPDEPGLVGVHAMQRDSVWITIKIFTLEMLTAGGRLDGTMTLTVEYDLAGLRPAELIDGLKVLSAWRTPNRVAFAPTFGPRNYGVVATIDTDRDGDSAKWALVCEALARIQDHVPLLLRMPAEMSGGEASSIIDAAKLVSGQAVTGPMSGAFTVHHQADEPEIAREPDRLYEFIAIKAIKISLGDDTITVGKQAMFFRGHYTEIMQDQSKIQPLGEGVSVRYDGELEVTRVLARYVPGPADVVESETDEGSEPSQSSLSAD